MGNKDTFTYRNALREVIKKIRNQFSDLNKVNYKNIQLNTTNNAPTQNNNKNLFLNENPVGNIVLNPNIQTENKININKSLIGNFEPDIRTQSFKEHKKRKLEIEPDIPYDSKEKFTLNIGYGEDINNTEQIREINNQINFDPFNNFNNDQCFNNFNPNNFNYPNNMNNQYDNTNFNNIPYEQNFYHDNFIPQYINDGNNQMLNFPLENQFIGGNNINMTMNNLPFSQDNNPFTSNNNNINDVRSNLFNCNNLLNLSNNNPISNLPHIDQIKLGENKISNQENFDTNNIMNSFLNNYSSNSLINNLNKIKHSQKINHQNIKQQVISTSENQPDKETFSKKNEDQYLVNNNSLDLSEKDKNKICPKYELSSDRSEKNTSKDIKDNSLNNSINEGSIKNSLKNAKIGANSKNQLGNKVEYDLSKDEEGKIQDYISKNDDLNDFSLNDFNNQVHKKSIIPEFEKKEKNSYKKVIKNEMTLSEEKKDENQASSNTLKDKSNKKKKNKNHQEGINEGMEIDELNNPKEKDLQKDLDESKATHKKQRSTSEHKDNTKLEKLNNYDKDKKTIDNIDNKSIEKKEKEKDTNISYIKKSPKPEEPKQVNDLKPNNNINSNLNQRNKYNNINLNNVNKNMPNSDQDHLSNNVNVNNQNTNKKNKSKNKPDNKNVIHPNIQNNPVKTKKNKYDKEMEKINKIWKSDIGNIEKEKEKQLIENFELYEKNDGNASSKEEEEKASDQNSENLENPQEADCSESSSYQNIKTYKKGPDYMRSPSISTKSCKKHQGIYDFYSSPKSSYAGNDGLLIKSKLDEKIDKKLEILENEKKNILQVEKNNLKALLNKNERKMSFLDLNSDDNNIDENTNEAQTTGLKKDYTDAEFTLVYNYALRDKLICSNNSSELVKDISFADKVIEKINEPKGDNLQRNFEIYCLRLEKSFEAKGFFYSEYVNEYLNILINVSQKLKIGYSFIGSFYLNILRKDELNIDAILGDANSDVRSIDLLFFIKNEFKTFFTNLYPNKQSNIFVTSEKHKTVLINNLINSKLHLLKINFLES